MYRPRHVTGFCARLGSHLCALALLAAVVPLTACEVGTSAGRDAGGIALEDASAGGDASAPDAAAGFDGGPRTDAGGPRLENDDRACGDFLDNDANAVLDCDDPSCAESPICCVGRSDPGCCGMGTALPASFASCTRGASLMSCMPPGTVLFGSPVAGDGAIIPNSATLDSGALLPGRFDATTTRLTVRGELTAGEPCTDCTEVVGFGVTSQTAFTLATEPLSTSVSVLLGRRDRVVRLLIADDLVEVLPLSELVSRWGGTDDAQLAVELELAPDGTFDVRIGPAGDAPPTTVWTGVRWSPSASAAIAVWGRSDNPGPGERRASLAAVTVTPWQCDVPSALGRDAVPVMPDDVDPWDAARVSSASVTVWGAESRAEQRMALAIGGSIWIAHGVDGGRFRIPGATSSLPNAALAPPAGVAYDDPQLVRDETRRRWLLYLTERRGGVSSIAVAEGAEDFGELFSEPMAVVVALGGDVLSVDDPEVFEAEGARGMLLRTHTLEGTQLRLLRETFGSEGREFVPIPSALATSGGRGEEPVYDHASIVHRSRSALEAFDLDEVAAPTLVRVRGLYRIYFAGRRGTRWSIGALVSADLVHFQLAEHGAPLLRASGGGFDALSVAEPSAVVLSGEPLLRLYYAGGDGVRSWIGLAQQAVLSEGG